MKWLIIILQELVGNNCSTLIDAEDQNYDFVLCVFDTADHLRNLLVSITSLSVAQKMIWLHQSKKYDEPNEQLALLLTTEELNANDA